jgi:hypothetical protein
VLDSLTHSLEEGRIFPIRPLDGEGNGDRRFTAGLLFDIRDLLAEAGYPVLHGGDLVDLQQALYRFLYVGDGDAR